MIGVLFSGPEALAQNQPPSMHPMVNYALITTSCNGTLSPDGLFRCYNVFSILTNSVLEPMVCEPGTSPPSPLFWVTSPPCPGFNSDQDAAQLMDLLCGSFHSCSLDDAGFSRPCSWYVLVDIRFTVMFPTGQPVPPEQSPGQYGPCMFTFVPYNPNR